MTESTTADVYSTPKANEGIKDKDDLFSHLYDAARLEMQTIPMYLYAGYSIATENASQWAPGPGAFRLIRSIVTEEMLHLSLVRNLIVSIGYGDHIRFCDPDFIPTYPTNMLHRKKPLKLELAPLTPDLVRRVFMEFEKPAAKAAPPQSEEYDTIGQFYKAVYDGFIHLAGLLGVDRETFDQTISVDKSFPYDPAKMKELFGENRPDLQYVQTYWNEGGGGKPLVVHDLPSALAAINMIVEQGEGMDEDKQHVSIHPEAPEPGQLEQPHYVKFERIAKGWEPIGDVYAVPDNPRVDKFPEGHIQDLGLLCNAAYTYVLRLLDEIYTTSWSDVLPGKTSRRYGLERQFVSAMQGLLFGVIRELVRTPITTGKYQGSNAAPTFEFYDFPAHIPMTEHMEDMCGELLLHYPRLGGDNSVLWLLKKMPGLYCHPKP